MVTLSDILYAFALSMALNGCAGSASAAGSTGILRSISRRMAARSRCTLMPSAALISAVFDLEHQRALLRQRTAHACAPRDRASRRPGYRDRIAPTRTTARCCSCRLRRRHCGPRPRRGPARAASSPAAPGPAAPGKRVQSPAAKISGSEVRHCASTTMPSCTVEACGFRERVVGLDAGADHDEIGDEQIAFAGFERDAAVELRASPARPRSTARTRRRGAGARRGSSRRFPRRRRAP